MNRIYLKTNNNERIVSKAKEKFQVYWECFGKIKYEDTDFLRKLIHSTYHRWKNHLA